MAWGCTFAEIMEVTISPGFARIEEPNGGDPALLIWVGWYLLLRIWLR